MEVTGEKGLGKILKVILQIGFYAGIGVLITTPFILSLFGLSLGASMYVIYPNGIVLLLITRNFIKLFDSLEKNNPFCDENVKILKNTGVVTSVGSLIWLIDLLFEIFLAKSDDIVFNFTLAFLSILFFGVSIALYILSELLNQATKYKKENELTI